MKPFTTLTVAVLALVALAHLCRLILGFDVIVGGTTLPQWLSLPGLIVAAGLATMLWRESRG